jgi:hypothetical protein
LDTNNSVFFTFPMRIISVIIFGQMAKMNANPFSYHAGSEIGGGPQEMQTQDGLTVSHFPHL